jgi:5-methyltetrahydrofolate--homocysteine methyltransferase
MTKRFLQALYSGRVLLMDGAMGTQLQGDDSPARECYERCNMDDPQRVLAIHEDYARSGAEVLLTNTFQANHAALSKHRLDDQLEFICAAAIRLARQAAGMRRFVLADIGPWSGPADDLARIASALTDADGLFLETFSDVKPLQFLAGLRQTSGALAQQPVLFSCTYLRNTEGKLQTFTGMTPESVAQEATRLGADALGANCGCEIDIDDLIEITCRYRSATKLPLFARPNAGTPTQANGQWIYPRSPEQMVTKLRGLLGADVTMVGGCCGTTPAHIAAFKQVIDAWNAQL